MSFNTPIATNANDPHHQVFAEQGFTSDLCKAFQLAANELHMVVLSRVPGGSCTDLIAAGHDLKGHFIKAKSCDFGPMSGFLCQLPLFNKSGAEGMRFNASENDKTVKKYDRIQKFIKAKNALPNDEEEKQLAQYECPQGRELRLSAKFRFDSAILPFCRIKISAERATAIQNAARGTAFGVAFTEILSDDSIYGIAHNKSESVYLEFLLRRDATEAQQVSAKGAKAALYSVYHGQIYYLRKIQTTAQTESAFFSFLGGVDKELFPYADPQPNERHRDTLVKILSQMNIASDVLTYENFALKRQPDLKVQFVEGTKTFYPVLGIKNHYPPYDAEGGPNLSARDADYYKNAVTGDYDLFAVWPKRGSAQSMAASISRLSEKGTKRFSVLQNGVWIDIIPSYAELENPGSGMDEDPRLGNITDNVMLVAKLLNSLAMHAVDGVVVDPNKVIHGDEGGRPGVTSLELPTAVFVPCEGSSSGSGTLAKRLLASYQRDMLKTKADFLSVVHGLKRDYQIQLQLGWLYDLLVEAKTNDAVYRLVKDIFALDARTADAAAAISLLKPCVEGVRSIDQRRVVSTVTELLAKLSVHTLEAQAKGPVQTPPGAR